MGDEDERRLALLSQTLEEVEHALSGLGVEAREETRFLVDVPDMPVAEAIAISPDGRTLAYSGRDSAATAIFVAGLVVSN